MIRNTMKPCVVILILCAIHATIGLRAPIPNSFGVLEYDWHYNFGAPVPGPYFHNKRLRFWQRGKKQPLSYGCNFDDEYNVLDTTTKLSSNGALSYHTPIYGQGIVHWYRFQKLYEVINFIRDLTKLYANFIGDEVFNNVDTFLDFYETCVGKLMDECYKNYKPKLADIRDASGLAVKWMERVIGFNYTFVDVVYLASSEFGPYVEGMSPNPKSTADYNVAQSSIWREVGQRMEYKKIKDSIGKFIDVEGKTFDQEWIVGNAIYPKRTEPKKSNQILYYVTRSYCSFIQYSVKLAMLTPKRMIVRRDIEGQVVAAMSTVYYPQKPNPTILLEYHVEKLDGNIYVLEIPVGNVTAVLKQEENFKFLEIVSENLKMPPQKLWEKIHRLATIFEKNQFVADLADFAEKNGVDTSDRGKFWDARAKTPEVFNRENVKMNALGELMLD